MAWPLRKVQQFSGQRRFRLHRLLAGAARGALALLRGADANKAAGGHGKARAEADCGTCPAKEVQFPGIAAAEGGGVALNFSSETRPVPGVVAGGVMNMLP
jgi:hypothetical protein